MTRDSFLPDFLDRSVSVPWIDPYKKVDSGRQSYETFFYPNEFFSIFSRQANSFYYQ